MRKVVSSKQILASTALAATLAVFGCSTNKMPGDGQPSSMPYHSPATAAPTNGISGGARPGTSGGITPMISSGPASMTTPAVDSYALIAEAQGFRGRILGPSFPGQPDISETMPPTGQFQNPALVANPEVTVNRSISSEPTPAYINDTGAGLAIVSSGAATAGVTAASTVAGTGTTGTVAAPLTVSSAAAATPGQVVIGTPTPTQSSIGVPSPTIAVNPVVPARAGTTTPTTTTNTAAVTAPSPTTQQRAIGNVTIPSAASLPTMISSSGSTGTSTAVTLPSTITPVTTTTTPSRTRAVRTTSATSQTSTVAPSRTRAVRLTTSSNGTPMITNNP